MVSEAQWRATYEDTKSSQDKLRKELDKLESENRVMTEDERNSFFDNIADSTYGLGNKPVRLLLPNHKAVKIPNFEQFLRVLAYQTKNILTKDFFYDVTGDSTLPDGYTCDISKLWYQSKIILFGIFPEALIASLKMSKERELKESTRGGFTFGKKTESESDR